MGKYSPGSISVLANQIREFGSSQSLRDSHIIKENITYLSQLRFRFVGGCGMDCLNFTSPSETRTRQDVCMANSAYQASSTRQLGMHWQKHTQLVTIPKGCILYLHRLKSQLTTRITILIVFIGSHTKLTKEIPQKIADEFFWKFFLIVLYQALFRKKQ